MARIPRGPTPLLLVVFTMFACTPAEVNVATSTTVPATSAPSTASELPSILAVDASAGEVGNYGLFELMVDLEADYGNPFDQRQVSLDAVFVGPDGSEWDLPGFWDARDAWRFRFTPSRVGDWSYAITVTDHRGPSEPVDGSFQVTDTAAKGWLRIGSDVDPAYSTRYLAYGDGTPWYGRGHADLDMALGGADSGGEGLRLLNEMAETGENFVMWWPTWGSNFFQSTFDDYAAGPMEVIDFVLHEAEAKEATLAYTIWTHQYLRTNAHPWGDDRWGLNGFSKLTDIDGFFVDPESLAWQENYYRYTIARWGYSPAIAMWQTVTEINGTESYEQTDPWHQGLNAYFQENDPYRHPTTATKSGSVDWPTGHALMDIPQVHLYEFVEDPIEAASQVAEWTRLMWQREEKPNWIGEYGERGQQYYPEMMHHSNWAALGAGAATTPIEWNDRSAYGQFDDEMAADMARLAAFVEEVPLVRYDPVAVGVTSSQEQVRGWAVVGERGGVLWAQDFALEGHTIDEIRADQTLLTGVTMTLDPIPAGDWVITPYDTWQGVWLDPHQVECPGGPCPLPLPEFTRDVALALHRP